MKNLCPPNSKLGSIVLSRLDVLQLLNQRVLWMKISITFLLFSVLGLHLLMANNGYGQGLKEEMVTIGVQGQQLQEVLQEIEQQTEYRFAYNADQITGYVVDLERGKRNLEETLNLILAGKPIQYKVVKDKFIVLSSVPKRKISSVVRPLVTFQVDDHVLKTIPLNVSGQIMDEAGEPLIGVNIQVKGTNKGTSTDFDGNFKLEDVDENAVLVVSYIGYQTQEVSLDGKSTIDVIMKSSAQQLSELVVTAMGISKGKGSLVSAVTEIKGSELTTARENNVANALAGKVAGVNVSGITTGPGGSSRIVIRGNGSLNGNNQPLYVINGMPMNNTHREASTGEGATIFDRGDGIAAINPDDIETMTVLKGGAAAALYGSRAANGVVLITTKQGRVQEGIGIELNSNFTIGNPLVYPDYQYEYGQGIGGARPKTQSESLSSGRLSFGGKMDGQPYIQFDGEMRPYSPVNVKDNWKNFYNPATNLTNSLAFSGGSSEALVYRLSLSDLRASALDPKSTYSRQTANLNIRSELGENKNFIIEATMQYNYELGKNRTGNGYADNSTNWALNLLANTVDVRNLAPGYDENFNEVQWQQVPESQNPYFVINRMGNSDSKHRFIGQGSIQYNVSDNLYIKVNGMRDFDRFESMDYMPIGTAKRPKGIFNSGNSFGIITSGQAIINYNSSIFGDFNVNVMGGGEIQRNSYESNSNSGSDFIIPDLISYNNLGIQSASIGFNQFGQNSLFSTVDFDYKKIAYITLTGRNDWFSVLNPGNNSIFYPSIGTSLIFSEMFRLPNFIDYAKIRGAWAQVGSATVSPYQVNQSYGFLEGGFGGRPVQTTSARLSNSDLRPLTSETYEIGIDADFLKGRLGLDLTYYNRKTTEDILNVPLAISSGYSSALLNVGALNNKGVEVLLTFKPIVKTNFSWNFSYNFSYNKSEILKLAPGINSVGGSEIGDPFNTIQANAFVFNDQGQQIFNSVSGYGVYSLQKAGTGVPPYIHGLSNSFKYKSFTLDVLVDGKFGNVVQSGLSRYMYRFGLSKLTLPGRDNGLTTTGVDEEGQPFSKTWPVEQLSNYYNRLGSINRIGTSIFDGSFIKLRSIILTYTIPETQLNIPGVRDIGISLVARNVALLYRKITDSDPESGYSVGNNQAYTSNTIPSTRDLGINLKVRF